jgi:Protein of unknown function (DUF1573)
MKKFIMPALLVVVAGVSVFLFIQNRQLKKDLDNTGVLSADKIAPTLQPTRPANKPDESPFDKPNTDPKASEFKPDANGPDKITSIKFDRMSYDFGRITAGDKVHTRFKFTNTGQWALVIAGAQGSCGCTVPQWPKTPIKPGSSDYIDVVFDSQGKHGETKKTVIVVSNTEPKINNLIITATVIPRDI